MEDDDFDSSSVGTNEQFGSSMHDSGTSEEGTSSDEELSFASEISIEYDYRYSDHRLIQAAKDEDLARVQELLMLGFNANEKDHSGFTALHHACDRGYLEIARLLVENGAVLNVRNKRRETPLHFACYEGHFDTAKLLIQRGANVEIKDLEGASAMHSACGRGRFDIVKLFLANGASLHAKDNEGRTPLHFTLFTPLIDLVTVLMANGADTHSKTNDGKTLLHFLAEFCGEGESEAVARLLIASGVDPNGRDNRGDTALHANDFDGLQVKKILVENTAVNINAKNNRGETPLHCACARPNNDLEEAMLFVENGADLNVKVNGDGKTPLHLACSMNNLQIVRLLLSRGANAQAKTAQGSTPMDVAAERDYPEIVWLLVRQCPWLVLDSD